MKRTTWNSTPMINIVHSPANLDRLSHELQGMHFAHGREHSVPFHKKRLGKQAYTWVGERRYWVWEGENWRAYANNVGGTRFEVRADLTEEQAMAAFDDYLQRTDLTEAVKGPLSQWYTELTKAKE